MKHLYTLLYIIALLALVACEDGNDFGDDRKPGPQPKTVPYILEVSPSSLSLSADAQTTTINIKDNGRWTATSSQQWCTLSATSGKGNASLTVNVSENTSGSSRQATITVTAGDKMKEVTVTQAAAKNIDDTSDGPEAVDLGLSVKWANMNVGANKPEDYGDYFAWGETEPKSTYNWGTYKYCNGSSGTMTKYCTSSSYGTVDNKTILEAADDAATANWGSDWRMPTNTEIQELLDNTTYIWTTRNGVNGALFTSKVNGNSIFLPAAGNRYDASLDGQGSYGDYWSASLGTSGSDDARVLLFYSGSADTYNSYRFCGQSVRAVLRN